MTTFNIDGPISEIITTPAPMEFSIASIVGGIIGSPVTIDPSGARRTIVIASAVSGAAVALYQLSSSFEIGDVVEIYNDTSPVATVELSDENGNDISCHGLAINVANKLGGGIYTKLRSTTGTNWGFTN